MKHNKVWLALLCAVLAAAMMMGCSMVKQHSETVNLFTEKTLTLEKPQDGVTWFSANSEIVTVDGSGKIKAIKPGSTDVTASVNEKAVEVFHLTVEVVPVASITLTPIEDAIEMNDTAKLGYTLSPMDASDYEIRWTSSDTSVATVAADGTVTGVAPGTATLTCTAPSGVSASAEITVTEIKAKEIIADQAKVEMDLEGTQRIGYTVVPETAKDHTATWTSSDDSVATVDQNGTVTAKKGGRCTVTVEIDGKKTEIEVEVSGLIAVERKIVGRWTATGGTINGSTSLLTGVYMTLEEDKTGLIKVNDEFKITNWSHLDIDSDSYEWYQVTLSNGGSLMMLYDVEDDQLALTHLDNDFMILFVH